MFDCELDPEPDLARASSLDCRQDAIEWIDLSITESRLYPKVLLERLRNGHAEIYWGDVN
jgi:hypothetical protein